MSVFAFAFVTLYSCEMGGFELDGSDPNCLLDDCSGNGGGTGTGGGSTGGGGTTSTPNAPTFIVLDGALIDNGIIACSGTTLTTDANIPTATEYRWNVTGGTFNGNNQGEIITNFPSVTVSARADETSVTVQVRAGNADGFSQAFSRTFGVSIDASCNNGSDDPSNGGGDDNLPARYILGRSTGTTDAITFFYDITILTTCPFGGINPGGAGDSTIVKNPITGVASKCRSINTGQYQQFFDFIAGYRQLTQQKIDNGYDVDFNQGLLDGFNLKITQLAFSMGLDVN
jgi:hypothetical protein